MLRCDTVFICYTSLCDSGKFEKVRTHKPRTHQFYGHTLFYIHLASDAGLCNDNICSICQNVSIQQGKSESMNTPRYFFL